MLTTNCSNNYGAKQHTEKLIPKTITSILNGEPITIHGKGNNIRDWLYVLDHCKAIIKVLHQGNPSCTYNIGGDQEMSNVLIVNVICELMDKILDLSVENSSKKLIIHTEDRPGNDIRYAIDSNKIKIELDWEKEEDFHNGIKKTILFYLNERGITSKIELPDYNQKLDHLVRRIN